MTEIFDPGRCVTIREKPDNHSTQKSFFITADQNEPEKKWYIVGGSVICYDAYYRDADQTRHHGKLRKFYLRDDSLDFMQEAENYIKPYKDLLRLIARSRKNQEIYSFVQPYSIYYDENGCPYIWTEGAPIKTFQEIIETLLISNNTIEEALYEIIKTLKTLTKCLGILHTEGLIHGDINPGNFGFSFRQGEVLADSLSLFDMNSMRYVWQKPVIGTLPFYGPWNRNSGNRGISPFLYYPESGNNADIRAVGMTLCRALGCDDSIIWEVALEINKRRGSLETIKDRILCGKMFVQKGKPRNNDITDLLIDIIRRTICPISENEISLRKRFPDCETLVEELQKLETMLLPFVHCNRLNRGMVLEIVNREEQRKNKVKSVYQKLLYDRPLYDSQGKSPYYNIAIFGFGQDAQHFLDTCLVMAQSLTVPFTAHVFSDAFLSTEKEIYLKNRPNLAMIFSVQGEEKRLTGEPYGSIRFHVLQENHPKDVVQETVRTIDGEFNYVFIATGNDVKNRSLAFECRRKIPDAAVIASSETSRDEEDRIYYVCPNDPMNIAENVPEINRMAFNAHLVWSGALTANLEKKKEKYNEEYYHESNISVVLSIKYKLHAAGIDYDPDNLYRTAESAHQIIHSKPEIRKWMAAAEHRRWVTEMICDGWVRMSPEEAAWIRDTKDKAHKRHICLVRGGTENGLEDWNDYSRWDLATKEDLKSLDELDQLSIRYHQAYLKNKDTYNDNLIYRENSRIKGINSKLAKLNHQSLLLFNELLQMMHGLYRDLYDKSVINVKKENLIIALTDLYARLIEEINEEAPGQEEMQKEVRKEIETIFKNFDPIVEMMRHRDFKKSDIDIVCAIPFILTYNENSVMIIQANNFCRPLNDINATEYFSWIAAATIVNPRELHIIIPPNGLLPRKERRLSCLRNFCTRKGLHSQIILHETDDFETEVRRIEQTKKDSWILIDSNHVAASLPSAGTYSFDTMTQTFTPSLNISWLNYIPELYHVLERKPGLTTNDIASLFGYQQDASAKVFISKEDADDLFGIYLSNRGAWKELCGMLKKENSRYSLVAQISSRNGEAGTADYTKFLPAACKDAIASIVEKMKEKHLIGPDSSVVQRLGENCKVTIKNFIGPRTQLDYLFNLENIHLFMTETEYRITGNARNATIQCDGITCKNVLPFGNEVFLPDIRRQLDELQMLGYLSYIEYDGHFDIIYSSKQIKKLFMSEGEILEIYIYYKAREMGLFDEVATGFVLQNSDETVAEIDGFLVKGYQTVIIECKAREGLGEQDIREMVAGITNKIKTVGINGKGILIIDQSKEQIPEIEMPSNIRILSDKADVKDPEFVFKEMLGIEEPEDAFMDLNIDI